MKTLKEQQAKAWSPKDGKWVLYGNGDICEGSVTFEKYRLFGTEFKTKEDAERCRDELHKWLMLWHLANELNEGWLPDCENENQLRNIVYQSVRTQNYCTSLSYGTNGFVPVFKDKEAAQKAINLIQNHGALE